jgi:hypothetical protein
MYSSGLGGGGGVSTITVPTVGDLPVSGDLGQFALVLDDNTVYIWDGSAWVLVGGEGTQIGHSGETTIANGSPSVAVVFPTAMPDLNYAITASITNLTDADPIYLIIVSTTKTTAGFTAEFNAPADSGNYTLEWQVSRNV